MKRTREELEKELRFKKRELSLIFRSRWGRMSQRQRDQIDRITEKINQLEFELRTLKTFVQE